MDQGHVFGRRIMNIRLGRVWLSAMVASLLLSAHAECEAGPLLDWLFGKPEQQTTYYATTATAAAAAGTTQQGCCGAGYCEQTVLRYQPQVAYRTVWQPVPVTTYKRTVSYNPTTGLPITCTQPCTSYTYQAKRVPYTTYRPYYATEPVTIPGNCPAPAATTTSVASVAPASCGCGSSPAIGSTGNVPYYSTPAATGSATSSPAGSSPWTRVEPGEATSPYSVPSMSPTPATGDPADQRPGIPPNIEPDLGARSIQRYGSSSDRTARNSTTERIDQFYRRSANRPQSVKSEIPRSSSSDWRSEALSRTRGFDSLNAPSNQRTSDELGGSSSRSVSPGRAANGVRPLPNLDFDSRDNVPRPRLLNDESEDRTASFIQPIPTRWNSNHIAWERRVGHQTRSNRRVRSTPIRRIEMSRVTNDSDARRLEDRSRFDGLRNSDLQRRRTPAPSFRSPRSERPQVEAPLYRFDSESTGGRPWSGNGWRSTSSR